MRLLFAVPHYFRPVGDEAYSQRRHGSLDGSAAPRQLTSGPWSSFFFFTPGLTWSADGTELLLTASQRPDWDRAPGELDIHAVRVADGAVRRLCLRLGPNFEPALELARSDARGHGSTPWGISKVEALAERARTLQAEAPALELYKNKVI